MKKTTLALLCLLAIANNNQAQVTNPAPYCAAQVASLTTAYNNRIKVVNVGTLSNNTGTIYLNGSEYAYYNNLTPVSIQKGINIPATFTVSKNDGELNCLWVFIDHNFNNTFEQTELVGQGSTQVANAGFGDLTVTFSLNIPANVQNGQTRMRIIYTSDFSLAPPTPTACNSNIDVFAGSAFTYGEIEDYNVNITGQGGSAPVASFTSPVSVCKNQNITLNDNSTNTPTAWSWTLTGATPSTSTLKNPVIKYANAGTYTIAFSSSNAGGMSQIVTKTISVNACTAIDESSSSKMIQILVYPNPGIGMFNLECSNAANIVIYNLIGEKIFESTVDEGKQLIDLSAQPSGVYYLFIQRDLIQQRLKLIKQ